MRKIYVRGTSGLFKFEFSTNGVIGKGDSVIVWTEYEKAKVTKAMDKVLVRVMALRKEVGDLMNSLTPCMLKELKGELTNLSRLLKKMEDGLTSSTQSIVFYHGDWGNADTVATELKHMPLGPWIYLNDTAKPSTWMDLTTDELMALLFHELSHEYGTEDDDSFGELMNAHTLQAIAASSKPFEETTRIAGMINYATNKCAGKTSLHICPYNPSPRSPWWPWQ